MDPSNGDLISKLERNEALVPGEIERLKAELAVIQWTGRGFIFTGIAASFVVAFRLAMGSTLSGTAAAFVAVGGAIAAYAIGKIGGFLLRAYRVDRLERIVEARNAPSADGVSAAGSTIAIPAFGATSPTPTTSADDEPIVVKAPHVVGAIVFGICTLTQGCDAGLCGELDALPREPRILAIGDSILAWNNDRCHAIPERAGLVAGVHVTNRAVSGTVMHEIVAQYEDARSDTANDNREERDGPAWDVVIVDGGGNDVNSFCACGECDAVLTDVRERTNALLDAIRDDGARVVLVDYFGFDERAWYGFDRCEAALADLQAIHEEIDAERDDVTLVDLGDLVTSQTLPEAYTFDYVHPSDEGSRILGELVAESLLP